MARWSFTKSRAWNQCPAAFWLASHKTPRVVPDVVKLGSKNHRMAEKFMERALSGQETPSEIVALLQGESDAIGADPKFLDAFAEMFMEVPLPEFGEGEDYLIEEKMRSDEDGIEGGDFWSGVVDYAVVGDNLLTVIDWKSGWGYGSKRDIEQVKIYAGAILELQGGAQEMVECRVMRPLRRWHDQETFTAQECRDAYLEHLKAGVSAVEQMESWEAVGDAEATPGSHCSSCFYRHSCPTFETMGEKVTWNNPEEAWRRRAVIKHELDSLEAYLKNQLELYGDLPAEGGRIRFKTSEVVTIDPAEAAAFLKEEGEPPSTFFKAVSLSKTGLNRALGKGKKDLAARIMEHLGKVSTRKQLDWTDKEE